MPFARKRTRSYSRTKYTKKRRVTARRSRRSPLKRAMRKTFMSLVETKRREYSYGKIESFHHANPAFCALRKRVRWHS